jgi:hypothetical protein
MRGIKFKINKKATFPFLMYEGRTDRLSRNVGKYRFTPRTVQEERRHSRGLYKWRNTACSPTTEQLSALPTVRLVKSAGKLVKSHLLANSVATERRKEALCVTVVKTACCLLGAFALPSPCPSVCPARMEKLEFHWTDFHEIWYLIIFRKNLSSRFKFH